MNSTTWEEDTFPLTSPRQTITTAQLHNTPLRRSDPINPRSSFNGIGFGIGPHALIIPPPSLEAGETPNIKKLDYTPSSRTVNSSEESWGSERSEHSSDEDVEEDDDERSEHSINSLSTPHRQKNQLRLTLNKAKQTLSFVDKWRQSAGATAAPTATITNPHEALKNTNTMPAVHHQDSPTPGESPGGRLSRWFSIRYKSQNYDVGAREGRHSTSSGSIDQPDATAIENSSPKISSSISCGGNVTLKELPENDEDLVVPHSLDLLLSSGPRSNKKTLANSLLILPTLPPAPPGITPEQLKRRHIVEAIVHSENSYVATLQRLVNVSILFFYCKQGNFAEFIVNTATLSTHSGANNYLRVFFICFRGR